MNKQVIYTESFVQSIKRKAATELWKYVAITALFVALCVAVCLLAAFDLVHVVVGCVINVLLSVVFMWYSYLFFAVLYKPFKAKVTFVKCLENAYPSVCVGKYLDCEDSDNYLLLHFDNGSTLKLDKGVVNGFVAGKQYQTEVVGDVVISYKEVDCE